MSMKLRELIKTVRSCKTAQEEREMVAKECALIRTSFKEGENSYRARNVAKLLYIHMLGYPTHFGQMECLKLIASPKFHEKRVGYLGLTQLLDESTEILMLVTNSIKNDINNPNQFISGTALCALGNIANQEMCLALSREVQNQLGSDNPLIRKKAALCAMRIIKRVDDIEDKFNPRLTALLEDKNHGVVVSGCSLLIHLLESNPKEYLKEFRHCPQLLVKTLKSILMSGYANAAEYDFSGVVDPFLQAKVLKLIRLFAQDRSILSSDDLNDILAQIATNTDASKNSGNAVLYECVQTIMSLEEAEAGLRVLGINILGKFLTSKDANVKYVALSMLQKVVMLGDLKSVQRHRTTVLECLRDADISIKRRALDVAYSLITAENVKSLTKDLMAYLVSAEPEFKGDLASRICLCIDKFSPDKKWHVDNTIKVLLLAGNQVSDETVFSLCHVVAGSPQLHSYAVHKLFYTLADPDLAVHPDALSVVASWIIGEHGHLLLQSGAISVSDILNLMDQVIRRARAAAADQAAASNARSPTSVVCEYVVCAIVKLLVKSNQTHNVAIRSRVEATLKIFQGSLSLDLQQRVSELLAILSPSWDDATRSGLLEVMPPAVSVVDKPVGDVNVSEAIPANFQYILDHVREGETASVRRRVVRQLASKKVSQGPASSRSNNIAAAGFDLDDLLGEATVIPAQAAIAPKVSDDLLNDLFA